MEAAVVIPNLATMPTVESLDEMRRRAELALRVNALDDMEPRRRRPALGGLSLDGPLYPNPMPGEQ